MTRRSCEGEHVKVSTIFVIGRKLRDKSEALCRREHRYHPQNKERISLMVEDSSENRQKSSPRKGQLQLISRSLLGRIAKKR